MKDAFNFWHDANARHDPKILALRKKYTNLGYADFFMIVEMLREAEDHRLPLKPYMQAAIETDLNDPSTNVEHLLNDCINTFDLFKSDGEYFWSARLTEQMDYFDARRKHASRAGKISAAKRALINERSTPVEQTLNECSTKNKELSAGYAPEPPDPEDFPIVSMGKNEDEKKTKDIPYIPFREIVQAYNETCVSMIRASMNVSTAIWKKYIQFIKARWKEEPNIEVFKKVFKSAEANKWEGQCRMDIIHCLRPEKFEQYRADVVCGPAPEKKEFANSDLSRFEGLEKKGIIMQDGVIIQQAKP